MQGAGEIGPRALGHRSIVADPSDPAMHRRLNDLKGREPLAPVRGRRAEPRARAALWEPRPRLSDYMLAGTPVSDVAREQMPSAIHVDGTTRPQELDPAATTCSPRCSPSGATAPAARSSTRPSTAPASRSSPAARDAIACFRRLGLDFLVLDDEVVARSAGWWRGGG